MIKYFNDNKSYYRWYMREKPKYDIISVDITRTGRIRLEYDFIKYQKRVIQYTLDHNIVKKWNTIRDIERELKISPEVMVNICDGLKIPTGMSIVISNYIWEWEKESDTNETSIT